MTSFKKCSKKGRENKEPFYREETWQALPKSGDQGHPNSKNHVFETVRDDVSSAVTHYPNLIFTETSESFKLENILTNTS